MRARLFAAVAAAATLTTMLFAAAATAQDKANADSKTPPPTEQQAVTEHVVTIAGQEVHYTATAGTILLKEEQGKAKASVFYVAYTRGGIENMHERPLTFAFNGGPGSSSVWLHLGMLGPKRVELNADGSAPPPPYNLVDNAESILDVTDLVMIDPVSTGFSRAVQGQDPKDYHGYTEDIESVGEFIRLYTTRQGRWLSPKFLIGESYGTTRAAGLSGYLQRRLRMYLNGIVLVSSVIDFQTLSFQPNNDLPYVLFLPTYTATAWYHKKLAAPLDGDLKKTLDEVEQFARGEYAEALFQGSRLSPEQENAVPKSWLATRD